MPPTEFATPTSAGQNESVVIKKVGRISEIHAIRGQSIVLCTEVANQDNATGEDRSVNKGPEVNRPLSAAVLAQTVTIGGQQVSLETLLKGIAKFYPVWRAEDIAAAAAAQEE